MSSSGAASGPPASGSLGRRGLRGVGWFGQRLAIVGTLLLILLGAGAAPAPMSPLSRAIANVTARHGFDLFSWEVMALAEGVVGRVSGALRVRDLNEASRRLLVEAYFKAASEAAGLQSKLDERYASGRVEPGDVEVADLQARLVAAAGRRNDLAEESTVIIAEQIMGQVANEGIDTKLLDLHWHLSFPPVDLTVTPPVFFRFTELPLLLVVAPRDKIAVIESDFLSPNLTIPEMQRLEGQIDQENASSIILPIGGFAAYPSMIPPDGSLRETLQVVAHEWTHQYLAMHPLGQRYFADYDLRTINETVAGIVGDEIGGAVYARYPQDAGPVGATTDGAVPAASATFDFGKAMVEIRQTVEQMLNQGDVDGAEQYMAERRDWLATNGYQLRKLNTAYLTFYGAYAGSGNSFEPALRRLRAQSATLGAFLHKVENISSERDFEALAVN